MGERCSTRRAVAATTAVARLRRFSDDRVGQCRLVRTEAAFERAKTLAGEIATAEIEPGPATPTCVLDRRGDQEVVGLRRKSRRVGRAVLVDDRPGRMEEHRSGDRAAVLLRDEDEPEPVLGEHAPEEIEEPLRLGRHAEPTPGREVQPEEDLGQVALLARRGGRRCRAAPRGGCSAARSSRSRRRPHRRRSSGRACGRPLRCPRGRRPRGCRAARSAPALVGAGRSRALRRTGAPLPTARAVRSRP